MNNEIDQSGYFVYCFCIRSCRCCTRTARHRSTAETYFPRAQYDGLTVETRQARLINRHFALAFPAGLRAQSAIPAAKNTMNESLDAWFEARETQFGKSAVPEMQPMLQAGILQVAGQASVKPWSMAKISTDTPRAERKSWISVGPGSLPLATTIQPDATQKYGADPATLQVYFGHRP